MKQFKKNPSLFDELVVDNFAGGGGTSTGLELILGRPVDIAINHDPEAIRLHKTNHPHTKHYCESVWDIDPVEVCEGKPVGLAWFSPDCTHFSKAKGNKPKDKNIRGLAWVALRWAGTVRPRVIMLENVEEFQTWGPLNRRHHPIKAKQGDTFRQFLKQLRELGYAVEHRELIAADYGAPTMRKRFFLIARCDGRPIKWPEPTHAPRDSEAVRSGRLKPYVGAYTQLDFSIPCPSIFDTSEEIKEKYGIRAVRPLADKTMRRIARGIKKFVLDDPDRFILDEQAPFLIQYHSETAKGEVRGQKLTDPIMTVDGSNRYALVSPLLIKYYGCGVGSNVKDPLDTVTSKDRFGLVTAMLEKYCGASNKKELSGKKETVNAFLLKYYGQSVGDDVQDPNGLVIVHGTEYAISDIGLRMLDPRELYNCQGFPDDYIIEKDYTGQKYSRAEQVKRCGNAVCPPLPAALAKANIQDLCLPKRLNTMAQLRSQSAYAFGD